MTAAPDDDTLGLNLVYTDPSSSLSSSLNGGGGIVKKPKRKTKYDRRRERGKLAKLAKDDEKRKRRDGNGSSAATLQQQGTKSVGSRDVGNNEVDLGGGSSSLAGIASLLGGSTVKEQKKRKIASSQSKPIDTTTSTNVELTSIEEKKEKIALDDGDTKEKAKVVAMEDNKSEANSIGKEESKLEAASPSSTQSTTRPLVENAKPTVSLAVEDTASSSRRHRVSFYAFKSLCTSYAFSNPCISYHSCLHINYTRHKQHYPMNNRQPIYLNFMPDHETWIGVNMPRRILKLVRLVHISLIPPRVLRRRMMWMWIKKDKQRIKEEQKRHRQHHRHVHLPS